MIGKHGTNFGFVPSRCGMLLLAIAAFERRGEVLFGDVGIWEAVKAFCSVYCALGSAAMDGECVGLSVMEHVAKSTSCMLTSIAALIHTLKILPSEFSSQL